MSDQSKSLSAAVLLVVVAVLVQLGVATYRGQNDKQALQSAIASQQAPLEEIQAVRQQLNTITGLTMQLAQDGNTHAAAIIEQMRAAGVNFSQPE
jgi:hypothetical protein